MTDIHSIIPPADFSLISLFIQLGTWILLFLILLGLVVFLFVKYFTPKQKIIEAPVVLPNFEQEAFEKIETLKRNIPSIELRAAFTLLSEILREYITNTQSFSALYATVEDVLDFARQKFTNEEKIHVLKDFFQIILRSEFAEEKALQKDFEKAIELAKQYIKTRASQGEQWNQVEGSPKSMEI